MRIVAIPADRMSYRANRRTKFEEEIETREDSMDDCVVLLSSAEKLDERNPDLVIEVAKDEVRDRLRICPYAGRHATSGAHIARTRSGCRI